MSDPQSQDHWKDLAQLLGAEIPEEPEEEAADESAVAEIGTPGERADESLGEEGESEPRQEVGLEPPTPAEPAKPAAQPPRPRPPAPKPDPNHWRGLAGALGIEVPEGEFEEPQAAEETEEGSVDTLDVAAELPVPALPEEPVAGEEEFEPVEEPEPAAEAESFEPAPSVEEPAESDERPTRSLPSLFDDESFDSPWALDRIFEQDVPEQEMEPAEPAGFEDRDAFLDLDEEFGDDERGSLFDAEDEDTDEAEQAVGVADRESAESETEEPRRRRKRRRRRRKGSKKDATATSDEDKTGDADTDLIDEDSTGEVDDLTSDHDDEDDEPSTLGVKHRKIPTWEEAVGVVISANTEARAKNPGGGARGRGRGRGRRS